MRTSPTHIRRDKGRRGGFTLIEVTVVAILMCLLLGMAVILLGNGAEPSELVRFTSRKLAGKLEEGRWLSIEKNRLVRVIYDFDRQKMSSYVVSDGNNGDPPEELPGDGGHDGMSLVSIVEFGDPDVGDRDSKIWLESVQTYNGKTTGRGQLTIDILPEGSSIGHVATITSRNGEVFAVELNPLTGVARVYDEDHKVAELKKD